MTDADLQQLIRLVMVPNKEVLDNISIGKWDELSTCFNNMCNAVYEYAHTSDSQQLETTKDNLFGVYNAVKQKLQIKMKDL